MALTASTMLPLGTNAPAFSLMDVVSGKKINLQTFTDKQALLVMFVCTHCPYVKHVQSELARVGSDYRDKSVGIVAISANDPVSHPDDAPEKLKAMAEKLGFSFPYCFAFFHANDRCSAATQAFPSQSDAPEIKRLLKS